MQDLTPRKTVEFLDRYIVGQKDAKKAVAIALRNRWRRQQLDEELRNEIMPKNIIMIGPTGVGKTEIARRLAQLVSAPFIKVEASKYTEVGYHGRDVESMVRDLVDASINLVQTEEQERVREQAAERVAERLVDLLLPIPDFGDESTEAQERRERTRAKLRKQLEEGVFEERKVELQIEQRIMPVQIMSTTGGLEQMDIDFQQMIEKMIPKQHIERQLTVAQARKVLMAQEMETMIDRDQVAEKAIDLAEQGGVIFVDEIDKVCGPSSDHGPDVSRQGVQRDLLPIVEGTTVQTRYGPVKTDHILFIAAGAFHVSKPADLMPEMQGRFPIRVELTDLTKQDFSRILREPKNSLTKQYVALLGTENVTLEFTDNAIDAIAEIAYDLNQTTQNIGARRLHTIMERLVENISFEAPERSGETVTLDDELVQQQLANIVEDEDLSKYIL